MEIFLRDPKGLVPKVVPPDKSVGAWPSVQEKTTGIENVGKSPCGGTNDEHQSLKVQESLCEHSVVANQEDIPTGERAGIHLLPHALDPEAVMSSLIEMHHKHQSLATQYYECALECDETYSRSGLGPAPPDHPKWETRVGHPVPRSSPGQRGTQHLSHQDPD